MATAIIQSMSSLLLVVSIACAGVVAIGLVAM
jgi:hypothetical protein